MFPLSAVPMLLTVCSRLYFHYLFFMLLTISFTTILSLTLRGRTRRRIPIPEPSTRNTVLNRCVPDVGSGSAIPLEYNGARGSGPPSWKVSSGESIRLSGAEFTAPRHPEPQNCETVANLSVHLEHNTHVDGSLFWIVAIGVDAYTKSADVLQGCVEDALAVARFHINKIHVPPNQIQLLIAADKRYDTSPIPNTNITTPTRQNIIKALYSLRDNPCIPYGANIVIHFSGHGAQYRASELFPGSQDKIEALCPSDRGSFIDNEVVVDISDREINILLSEIRDVKGDRITVTLDCCHAGSVTRAVCRSHGLKASHNRGRSMIPLKNAVGTMLGVADRNTMKNSPVKALSDTWKPDMSSHVLMAACGKDQMAFPMVVASPRSTRVQGAFTMQLLSRMEHMERASYQHLGTFSLPKQTPVVLGSRKERLVWS